MLGDGIVAGVLYGLGFLSFGRFEVGVPPWRRVLRAALYLGMVLGLRRVAGPRWAHTWLLGLPTIGATFHVGWCLAHGIDPLNAEPRDRYYQARGWTHLVPEPADR